MIENFFLIHILNMIKYEWDRENVETWHWIHLAPALVKEKNEILFIMPFRKHEEKKSFKKLCTHILFQPCVLIAIMTKYDSSTNKSYSAELICLADKLLS